MDPYADRREGWEIDKMRFYDVNVFQDDTEWPPVSSFRAAVLVLSWRDTSTMLSFETGYVYSFSARRTPGSSYCTLHDEEIITYTLEGYITRLA